MQNLDMHTTRTARRLGLMRRLPLLVPALMLWLAGASVTRADPPWPAEWPIVLPPVRGRLPPLPPPLPPQPPATRSAARVLEVIERVRQTMRETRYQHHLVVRERQGIYRWDCSLMAQWVLRRAAPRSVRHLDPLSRPLAEHFVRTIERAPAIGSRSARNGWHRVEGIAEVRAGDVFAWRRPPGFPSRNTGHVGFTLEAPRQVPGLPGGWAVRVADATGSLHQDDTRTWPGEGGFGIGVLVFLADAEGRGTHYGWGGTYSSGYVVTPILFGRVSP